MYRSFRSSSAARKMISSTVRLPYSSTKRAAAVAASTLRSTLITGVIPDPAAIAR